MDKKSQIKQLNDIFRTTGIGGVVVATQGVQELGASRQEELFSLVRNFNEFNFDNDPHQEHDFGAVNYLDSKFFWKIDYYDKNLRYGSEDPANPEQTTRVLTVFYAHEY